MTPKMFQTISTVIVSAALTLAPALAQESAQKEQPPAGGTPKAFAVPAQETYQLKNGMKVTLVPYGTVPVVTVSAKIEFGNANEAEKQTWLADMVCALMKEGAGDMTAEQIAQKAAGMGGQLQLGAGVDMTDASLEVLSDFAPDAVKLLATVLRQPTFPASELERVRANFLRRLSVELSNPGAVATQAFSKVVYGEAHPYGRIYPTEAELKSYTLDGIKAFYKANLGARRTHLYVAGRFDSSIKKTIATAFEGWEAGPEPKHDPPKVQPKYSFTLLDRPGAHQSVLRIGLPVAATANSADYIPFQVTDSILGGSFGSRITSNIREQKGYTYSPHSMFQTRYKTASWLEAADVTTKVTAESIKEIFFEVDRMRKDPPTEAELKGIQNYMSGIFVLRNSSPSGIINQLSFVDLHGLPADYLKTYVQKVNAVSRGDVQRIAESYLDPKKMTVVVVGDKSVIGESLKPYEEPKQ